MNILNKTNKSFDGILKLALILVLILILGFEFLNTWINDYNILLRFSYVMKGNIFVMVMYMFLLYIFMTIFDCNNLSRYQTALLIISESLSVIFCNIFAYFVIIMPAAAIGFLPFTPIIFLTFKDILIIIIWVLIVRQILMKFFPPKRLLLISSATEIDEIIFKVSKRKDLYEITDNIVYDRNNISAVYKKCDEYNDVLIGDLTSEDRNDVIKYCFNHAINIFVVPKLSDILIKYSDDIFIFDTPIYYSSNFSLSIESQFIKRIIDITISLIVLIVFLPFWLLISLLIKIEDGGPIFYTQKRVTINFKLFNVIKFRSMKVSDNKNVLPTTNDDDRITRIGKFIRKYHIDEVPQFINVLIGDMSIVGPRPERIEHVELYSKAIQEFTYRYKVKAGITGLAQIYGKYNTSAINKLKLDLIYIKKCNLMFDLELMFRTFKVLFIKDNTEGFDVKTQKYISENAR